MLKKVLENQRSLLNSFFDEINHDDAEKVVEMLKKCKGTIIFSGIGKSGHIAEKIAATFLSTGTRALYLDAVSALHGDIGLIQKGDVFVCLSKSGAAKELLDLIPYIRKKGASIIAIVSHLASPLFQVADFSMFLPVKGEVCPHNLAPTTSSAIQLIFGDALAVAMMEQKQFSIADFAANHPGGFLGRKITLKVADLMLKENDLPLCKEKELLIDCLHTLSIKRCGCLLITDDKLALKGIFTDGDLRRAIEKQGEKALKTPIEQLMTRGPKSIPPSLLAQAAVRKMEEDPSQLITVLPVLENERIVGLIRMHDILQKELL